MLVVAGACALAVAIAGMIIWGSGFAQNLLSEALGIVVTVAVIEEILRRRDQQRLAMKVRAVLEKPVRAWALTQAAIFMHALDVSLAESAGDAAAAHRLLRDALKAEDARTKLEASQPGPFRGLLATGMRDELERARLIDPTSSLVREAEGVVELGEALEIELWRLREELVGAPPDDVAAALAKFDPIKTLRASIDRIDALTAALAPTAPGHLVRA